MTEDQIKHMVNRFLNWRLPENFSPDGGVSFKRFGNEGTPHQFKCEPVGTNLLDADQATAMVRHMIANMPGASIDQAELERPLAKSQQDGRDLKDASRTDRQQH